MDEKKGYNHKNIWTYIYIYYYCGPIPFKSKITYNFGFEGYLNLYNIHRTTSRLLIFPKVFLGISSKRQAIFGILYLAIRGFKNSLISSNGISLVLETYIKPTISPHSFGSGRPTTAQSSISGCSNNSRSISSAEIL